MNRPLRSLEIFEQALDLPNQQRPSFLERMCGGDDALRKEVEELLATYHKADFLHTERIANVPDDLESSFVDQPSRGLNSGQQLCQRYEIVESLGSGGMGDVYQALDVTLDRHVA